MINLLKEYIAEGKIEEALLVGRNLMNRNPSDIGIYTTYMDFLLTLAESLPSMEDKNMFLGQANVTHAFFEENAEINNEMVGILQKMKKKIEATANAVREIDDKKKEQLFIEIENNNTTQLKTLYGLKDELIMVKTQVELDVVLKKIGEVDSTIRHDYLTEDQSESYNQINKDCTELISEKMRFIEHKSNVAYNKKAVDSYSNAFNKFKNNRADYKNHSKLFDLVSTTLFAYDASRLFNETLIYYNHVYSYIFGELDDTGKLELTRFSIECERKLR